MKKKTVKKSIQKLKTIDKKEQKQLKGKQGSFNLHEYYLN